ncbi:MAG: glutamine-hydrolyzing GMP synthase, partial [Caulobacteraceae bacterium]|nr:glutamine-hydrolyzing GMP synthase [Caulobacteraceae bacterium]
MTSPTHQRVLIVDFGSQVTQLIARRVRESGVFCEIHPFDRIDEVLAGFAPAAIILSGGPSSVHEDESPSVSKAVFEQGVPVLGICYGEQTMCAELGGRVEPGTTREFGRAEIEIVRESPLLEGLGALGHAETVWMSHGDKVTALPPGFAAIATSEGSPFAAIADEARRFYGVQFHPEVAHTPRGALILKNFTHRIAGLSGDWTMAAFRAEEIARIRAKVGKERVICGLSGGVDSSVAAVLLHEAIGDQLTCVFVDTGLLRLNEAEQVVKMFRDHYNIPLVHVDAAEEFLGQLAGVSDPETKRKIIGRVFVEIFDREAAKVEGATFLAQGTLYPDVIESVSARGGPSAVIKSHHNVGGLPDYMKLKLVEPLRELFKDEVRALGVELGLPPAFVGRHPFPGPGLAIRIPGEVTPERVAILQKADAVYLDEIRKAGLYDAIWQAFAVLLPVRTVGVKGDARTYDEVCALRAV